MRRKTLLNLGTVFAVTGVLALSSCTLSVDDLVGESHFTNFTSSAPLTDNPEAIEARVDLAVGTLEIESGKSSDAYDLDLYYNQAAFEPKVDFSSSSGVAHLRFDLSGEGRSVRRLGKTRLQLRLNPDTALRLETRTGVGESQIDLSGMKVSSLSIEAGVGESKLFMLTPNPIDCRRLRIRNGVGSLEATGLGNFNFQQFEFQGGVGAATLDFSGAWQQAGEIEIEVGVGGVEIIIPRSVGAEVTASKSFLSGLDISGFTKKGDTYFSDNIDRVDIVLRLRIRTGIGGVEIRWL